MVVVGGLLSGSGDSNHRHWTRTGLSLSLSFSTLAFEERKEQLRDPRRAGRGGGGHSDKEGLLGNISGFGMKGRVVSWIEGRGMENVVVALLLLGFTTIGGDSADSSDLRFKSRLLLRSRMWDRAGEVDLEPEDREIVSVQRANLGGSGGGETFCWCGFCPPPND